MAIHAAATAVAAVQLVDAVDKAQQRIPTLTPQVITYFSVHDVWVYVAVMDNRVCPLCLPHEHHMYRGNELRHLFPYLEITSLESIHPHTHMPRDDNCRCRLDRVQYWGDVGVAQPVAP